MGTTTGRHTVISNIAVVVRLALEDYGLDGRAILDEVGINYDAATDPDTRISLDQDQEMWRVAEAETGDPCFGLVVGQMIQPSAIHGLGLGWLASTSIKAAFDRLVKYQAIVSSDMDIVLVETPERYILKERSRLQSRNYDHVGSDAMMALIVKLTRIIFSDNINPTKACLAHTHSECFSRYEKFYRCEVVLGAPEYRLEFDKAVADRILPGANPLLARINDQAVVDYLARYEASDLVTQVRSAIVEEMVGGSPSQVAIARFLNMSLRQMQRRLKDHGTSFRSLTREVRQELARQYLREKHKSIGEISFLLGYSEPANFTRSFRGWHGKSPREYLAAEQALNKED